MSGLISHLKNKQLIWQASQRAINASAYTKHATGIAELDHALQGGFPNSGVVRINSTLGIGELRLCMPVLQQRQTDQRQLFILAPPAVLNGEMLLEYGVAIERTFFVEHHDESDRLWACEQCLKSGISHSVILWQPSLTQSQAKRLQLAAEQGDCLLLLFQPADQAQALPISLSMQLARQQQSLQVTITKQRGGWPVPTFSITQTLNTVRRRHHTINTTTDSNIIPLHAQR